MEGCSLTSSPLTSALMQRPWHVSLTHSRHSLSPPADLNECGLKPRPCKHRCMNTYGSYKCYCLNGYMLMPDGSCGSECNTQMQHTHTHTQVVCPHTPAHFSCTVRSSQGSQPSDRNSSDTCVHTVAIILIPRFCPCLRYDLMTKTLLLPGLATDVRIWWGGRRRRDMCSLKC